MSYLDTGLASTYFSEADQLVIPPTGSPNSLSQTASTAPQRTTRRYKTQLRDFLSTCRSKRKLQQQQQQQTPSMGQVIALTDFKWLKNFNFHFPQLQGYITSTRWIHFRSKCSCRGCIYESESHVHSIAVPIVWWKLVHDTIGALIEFLPREPLPPISAARCWRILSGRLSPFNRTIVLRNQWVFAVRQLWHFYQRRKVARRWKILFRSWCN